MTKAAKQTEMIEETIVTEFEEKVIAKVKIGLDGRCESANCEYTDQDVVIEREFESEAEALEFYTHLTDYVYKDGVWVLHPLPIPEPPISPIEELQKENHLLKAQVQALTDQGEFQDDLIAELAMIVYA